MKRKQRNMAQTGGRGERANYRKVTVTLPPDVYRLLVQESSRRKIAGESNSLMASIVREAVTSYLSKKDRSGFAGTAAP